jgi:hypothetical protein
MLLRLSLVMYSTSLCDWALLSIFIFVSLCPIYASLRSSSGAARLLRLWVRIPPGAWMLSVVSVVCCHLKSLRRADHPSRGVLPTGVRRCVWSRNLVNEEALAHWGLLRQIKNYNLYISSIISPLYFVPVSHYRLKRKLLNLRYKLLCLSSFTWVFVIWYEFTQ